jgi:hypothetical protein
LGVGVSVDLDEGEIMVLFYRGEGDVEGWGHWGVLGGVGWG